ncbi:MAG: DUF4838 domain-containing protein [Phycisphaeraceae bacterium]
MAWIRPAGLVVALGGLLLLAASSAAAVTLVREGKPAARVHVDPRGAAGDNAEVLADAGQWLADSLERATGTRPAVADQLEGDGPWIVIGLADQYADIADAAEFTDIDHPDAFCMAQRDDRLYILGRTAHGARHGVATLLHELGFRFYNPMPRWHVIPTADALQARASSLELPRIETPTLRGRNIWHAYGFYRGKGSPGRELLMPAYRRWTVANRLPSAAPFSTGHSYGNIIGRNREAFEQHPEYFALLENGKRDTERHVNARKLCYSNPDLARLVIADRIKKLEEARAANPHAFMVSMDPSDGQGTCHCDDCKALGTTTDRVIHLANQVARGLRDKYPDAWVGLYAYSSHRLPPTIDVEPNVYVQVAMAFNNTEYSYKELVARWAEKVSAIGLREYYGVEHWDWGLPGAVRGASVDYHRQTIPYFVEHNLNAINAESNANWGAQTLGFYVATRMMWNVDVDVDAIVDEYFDKLFGSAAAPMRRLHAQFDEKPRPIPAALLPLFKTLEEAYQVAEDETVRGRLIDKMAYLHYVLLFGRFQQADKQDSDHGEHYYEALGELMQYAWQTRERGMIHYYALARRLCNVAVLRDHRPDHWIFLGDKQPSDEYLQEAGIRREDLPQRAVWKQGDELSDEAIRALFEQDLAALRRHVAAQPSFSEELRPVRFSAEDGDGNDEPTVSKFRGTTHFHVRCAEPGTLRFKVAPTGRRCQVAVTAADGRVIRERTLESEGDESPLVDMAVELPEAGRYELTLSGGVRFQAVRDGSPAMSLALKASTVHPVWADYSGGHYFYVPRGTEAVEVEVGGRLSLSIPGQGRRDVHGTDREPDERYVRIAVPEGADGQLWHTLSQTRGSFGFHNIPPYLSFDPGALLVPKNIVEADRLETIEP